jgi:xanthine dehydrogenase large subunit
MPAIGRSLPHDSAREHVTGEAVYLDDLPPIRGELYVDFAGSPVAHGRITRIDVSAALAVPGTVAAFTSADVPGDNHFGPVFHDEELLASETVQYLGQPVVVLAGTDADALRRARGLVRIEVAELPPVLTIDAAIDARQFIGPTRTIRRGDADAALAAAERTLEGEFFIGGQEHFYLETQVALAVPGEGGQVTVHSSTQNPSEIQAVVAHCLGVPLSHVVCVCKRMGGGFGGKETQAAQPAVLAALVAAKTRRPARVVLDHDRDFTLTGKRHPYLVRYRVGFTGEGIITAFAADFWSDGGSSADLSLAVMERTLLHSDNAYFIPDVTVTGTVCRTNKPSNTAFRGFGGPQGVAAVENVIEEVAAALGLDALEVRRRNLYGTAERNVTPYGQVIRHNPLPGLIDRLAETSDYARRRHEVRAFNRRSRTHLRGLALTLVKFGISFTRRTLNQGNALVNVYLDGTVQVSTGGTEMGQGLNTKLRQLVADQFAITPDTVLVMPTSTEKNNNTSPTAASASTDLNGTAAVRAARAVRDRLAAVAADHFADAALGLEASPFHVVFADGQVWDQRRPADRLPFVKLVRLAYELRVDLGARGFYATPGVDYNRETGRGNPFLYYTNGAAAAEVLIDRFTGETRVERVDLLMDVGEPLNPAIDRGQVVGGFVQGMGWVTGEELRYGSRGELLSHSASTYMVPLASDIPAAFTVEFFPNPHNTENLYGSKAVGEPPLLLGVSVWAAVKAALADAAGVGRVPRLLLPATTEEVLTRLTELLAVPEAAGVG